MIRDIDDSEKFDLLRKALSNYSDRYEYDCQSSPERLACIAECKMYVFLGTIYQDDYIERWLNRLGVLILEKMKNND